MRSGMSQNSRYMHIMYVCLPINASSIYYRSIKCPPPLVRRQFLHRMNVVVKADKKPWRVLEKWEDKARYY